MGERISRTNFETVFLARRVLGMLCRGGGLRISVPPRNPPTLGLPVLCDDLFSERAVSQYSARAPILSGFSLRHDTTERHTAMTSNVRLAALFALWTTLQQCNADTTSRFIAADFVRTALQRLLCLR